MLRGDLNNPSQAGPADQFGYPHARHALPSDPTQRRQLLRHQLIQAAEQVGRGLVRGFQPALVTFQAVGVPPGATCWFHNRPAQAALTALKAHAPCRVVYLAGHGVQQSTPSPPACHPGLARCGTLRSARLGVCAHDRRLAALHAADRDSSCAGRMPWHQHRAVAALHAADQDLACACRMPWHQPKF
jgi:hypothetical protein